MLRSEYYVIRIIHRLILNNEGTEYSFSSRNCLVAYNSAKMPICLGSRSVDLQRNLQPSKRPKLCCVQTRMSFPRGPVVLVTAYTREITL